MFVISSHALARDILRDPEAGMCVLTILGAMAAYPDRPAEHRFDGPMLVRALLQETGEPFIVRLARCQKYPLILGNGDWSDSDKEALRVRLANRLLAAPDRRLVLPENDRVSGRFLRPSYIETL